MPTYPYTQGQELAGLDYGPSGNAFTPYGDYGPHYNLVIRDTGLRGGDSLNAPGRWKQEYNPMATTAATLRYPAGGPRSGGGGGGGFGGTAVGIAVIDPLTGRYVHPVTRQPFTGTDASGRSFSAGQLTGEAVPFGGGRTINPNDPNQRYQAVNIVKSPEIAAQTEELTKALASSDVADFGKMLADYKGMMEAGRDKAATAFDLGPYERAMRGYQGGYTSFLNRAPGDYEALNRDIAAREQAVVDEARGLIPEYDAAINRAGDYASRQLAANVLGRYATGATARSAGSGLARELIRGEAAIRVPLEQAKIAQRYNVLSQFAMPSVLDVAGRETARVAQFNPQIAAQQFQSGQNTEQSIMQAGMAMANMSQAAAAQYLQELRGYMDAAYMPEEKKVAILGALNQLYQSSRYQGLQDVLGTQVTPATYTSFTAPGYPAVPRYELPSYSGPDYGATRTATAAAPAPAPTAAAQPQRLTQEQYLAILANRAGNPTPQPGEQTQTWYYDPDQKSYVNRYTGEARPARGYTPYASMYS